MVVIEYHRPESVDDAIQLLARSGVSSVVLGGGTSFNATPGHGAVEAVDLQDLQLDEIEVGNGSLRIGSMVRLQELVDHASVPPLLRDLAKREAPSSFRNVASVGGTLATGDWESVLLAGFLAHQAVVSVAYESGVVELSLPDLLADRARLENGIITSLTIDQAGASGYAATGRTPADRPIVAAVIAGDGANLQVALTGVAVVPILIHPGAIADLEPPGDFRGSPGYRRELARVLTERLIGSQAS